MLCPGCKNELPDDGALCPSCGRFVAMDRKHSPYDHGKSLAVIALTLSIPIFAIFAYVATEGLSYSRHAQRSVVVNDAYAILPIVEKYTVDHPGKCPTMMQLRDEKEISASSKITDPWDSTYQISCNTDATAAVSSYGPDRTRGTEDDIIVKSSQPSSPPP
jgi:hypothetical protein